MKYLLQVYMNGADALLDALPDREKQAVYDEYPPSQKVAA